MNLAVLHRESSLIINIATTSSKPTDNSTSRFIELGTVSLDKYYKLLRKSTRNGTLVSAGELASASPSFLESLAQKA